jgi:hypothetical protein
MSGCCRCCWLQKLRPAAHSPPKASTSTTLCCKGLCCFGCRGGLVALAITPFLAPHGCWPLTAVATPKAACLLWRWGGVYKLQSDIQDGYQSIGCERSKKKWPEVTDTSQIKSKAHRHASVLRNCQQRNLRMQWSCKCSITHYLNDSITQVESNADLVNSCS